MNPNAQAPRPNSDIYSKQKHPNLQLRTELSNSLGMTARSVQIWFQNKRANEKQAYKNSPKSKTHSSSDSDSSSDDTYNYGSNEAQALLELPHDVNNSLDQQLLQSCTDGDSKTVLKLLQSKVDVDTAEDSEGNSPLILATLSGDITTVTLLLQSNPASVSKQNKNGQCALFAAVASQNVEMIHLLIEFGADVDSRNSHLETPLHMATLAGSYELVSLLLSEKARVCVFDRDGHSPLHHASMLGQLYIVKLLTEHWVFQEKTRLDTHQRNYSDAELLQLCAPFLNAVDQKLRTPLHCAALMGHVEVLKFLLTMNVDPEPKDSMDNSPLIYAARNNHSDCTFILSGSSQKFVLKPKISPQQQRNSPNLFSLGFSVDFPISC